jgi:hypothetical protein
MNREYAEEPQSDLYRVCWTSKWTGVSGRGQPIIRDVAASWVEHLNSRYHDLHHWVQEDDSRQRR